MPEMIKVPEGQLEEMKEEVDRIKATIETLEDQEVIEQIVESEEAVKQGKEQPWSEVNKELKKME